MQSHCCWLILHFACPSRNHPHHFSVKCTHTHTQKGKLKKTKKGTYSTKPIPTESLDGLQGCHLIKWAPEAWRPPCWRFAKYCFFPTSAADSWLHTGILGGSVLNFHPSVTQVWTPWKINLSLDICPQRQIVFPMKLTELSEHHTNKCSPLWGQITPLKNI